MAGVDQALHYSVEVKSRFSLFLDDPLGSEDPSLLLSKFQQERAEKKREKAVHAKERKSVAKVEATPVPESAKEIAEAVEQPQSTVDVAVPPHSEYIRGGPRGRGPPRGFPRFPRSARPNIRPPVISDIQDGAEEHSNAPDVNVRGFRARGRANIANRFPRFRGAERGFTGRFINRSRNFNGAQPDQLSTEESAVPHEMGHPPQTEISECAPINGGDTEAKDAKNNDTKDKKDETVHFTLEEYKAMRSASKPSVHLNNKASRAANDGQDVFANMVAHEKPVDVNDDEVSAPTKGHHVDTYDYGIDVTYSDRRGRGGGRIYDRNRGDFRGGRTSRGVMRGASRGRGYARFSTLDQFVAPPPPINDDQEFPSLSK